MADGAHYRQCTLRKGTKETVTWLPSKYAQKGRGVVLKKAVGTWDEGWVVVEVGARATADMIHDREHLHHRKVTDI
jgi:hypothetical protein